MTQPAKKTALTPAHATTGRAMVQLGSTGQAGADVDIYRDGDVVTVVARGSATRQTPYGRVETKGSVVQQYETVEAFEHDRDRAFARFPLAYTRIIGRLGVSDDARSAPPLPPELRHFLPDESRTLSAGTSVGGAKESRGRPYLLLGRKP